MMIGGWLVNEKATCLLSFPPDVHVLDITEHQITVRCMQPLSIGDRGHLLMECERRLRHMWADGEVFLEPMQDANAVRHKLRGITV